MAIKKNDDDGPSTPSKPSQAPKDLITLMNARNGETYKFACKTCIDGHRAPLCDPKKHRGKIMFRRPAPGRPARQCGHPKAAKCDCMAKRTLCCVLSSEQWDLVEQGQVVEVSMYDSREDLDAAQARPPNQSFSASSMFSESASTPVTHGSISSASTPGPVPRLQMFGVGGPQGDSKPGPDPFIWTGDVPQVSLHDLVPPYPTMPPPDYIPQPSSLYQQFSYMPTAPNTVPIEANRGSISHRTSPQTTWPQPRPEYMPFDQPQFTPLQDPRFEHLRMEQMHLSPELQAMPPPQTFPPSAHGTHFAPADQHHVFQPLPVPEISNFDMDADMSMQINYDPSIPPDDMQDVTQSCCSSKRLPVQQASTFHNWQYPSSAPALQFPCPRCASTMCTCTNCPEVMQNPLQNGAWATACGRAGHLDAHEYLDPNILGQQQAYLQQPQRPTHQQDQPTAPSPPAARSCCGGGDSGTATERSSPFELPIHNEVPWQQAQQTGRQQSVSFDSGMAMDQPLLYPNGWQNLP